MRLVEQAFRAADDTGEFCRGEFARARSAAARRGLQALESSHYLTNFLVSSLGEAGRESEADALSCEQVLGLNRQLSERQRQVWIVLGDAARIAEQMRQQGRRTEIVKRPCWASLY